MSSWAVLSMAVAGNMILLLASPPTPGVYALQATPLARTPPSFNLEPYSAQSSISVTHSPTSLSTSNLFGIKQRQRWHRDGKSQLYSSSSSSTPNGGSTSNNAMDAEITDSSSITKGDSESSSTSFLGAVDNFGMNLKPWALKAYERSGKYSNDNTNGTATSGSNNRVKSILCKLQANILWMLYIIYRGYRGFFVILPGVFREVHRQLKESDLVVDPYGDEEVSSNSVEGDPMKLRTRITISVLSVVLTASYVVTGVLRVLGKFIKTFTSTTSVESSLEAAADEVVSNEDKLRNKLK